MLPILPSPGDDAEDKTSFGQENPAVSDAFPPPSSGRITLLVLGPGVGPRTPSVQIPSTITKDQGSAKIKGQKEVKKC